MKHVLKLFALSALLALGLAPSANASIYHYSATLLGSNEVPPTGSAGTGLADVFWDTATLNMEVQVSFSGLGSPTTASHIHCCLTSPFGAGSVGVATTTPTFPGFPLGVTSGTYDHTFDMTLAGSYNPAFVTSHGGTVLLAEAAFFAGLDSDETYLNIHTTAFPGGEIRGILVGVPEPGSLALMLGGLTIAGAGVFARRRAKAA